MLDDDSLFRGYSYLSISSDVPLQDDRFFFKGIEGAAKRDTHLVNQNGRNIAELDIEEATRIIAREQEDATKELFGEGAEYDEFLVEIGDMPMRFSEYIQRMHLYRGVFNSLKGVEGSRPLKRSALIKTLTELGPGYARETKKRTLEVGCQELVIPSAKLDRFEDITELTGYLPVVAEIMRVYEELRAAQERIPQDLVAIAWEFRVDAGIWAEDLEQAETLAGRGLLKAQTLLKKEERETKDPRRTFDKQKHWSRWDAYRFAIARRLGILGEYESAVMLNQEQEHRGLEVSVFQKHFEQQMSPAERQAFDLRAKQRLEEIAKEHKLEKELEELTTNGEPKDSLLSLA